MRKLIVATSLFLVCWVSALAQDQAVFTQTVNLQGLLNPAYNGSRDAYSGLAVYRHEFAGFGGGSPEYMGFNVHAPLANTNLGVGLVILSEKYGLHTNLDIAAAATYRVDLNNDTKLSFGLQLALNSYSFDFMSLDGGSQADRTFMAYESASIKPNAGFGALLYTQQYFVGLAIPEMLYHPSDTVENKRSTTFDMAQMHIYLYGGYVFDLQNDFKVKPVALIRHVNGAPLLFDIGAYGYYLDDISLGLLYRWDDAIVAHVEFRIWEKMYLGYSYDYSTNELARVSSGSHEISLRMDFGSTRKYRRGMRSIRYF